MSYAEWRNSYTLLFCSLSPLRYHLFHFVLVGIKNVLKKSCREKLITFYVQYLSYILKAFEIVQVEQSGHYAFIFKFPQSPLFPVNSQNLDYACFSINCA
jgi:hypothetical protein